VVAGGWAIPARCARRPAEATAPGAVRSRRAQPGGRRPRGPGDTRAPRRAGRSEARRRPTGEALGRTAKATAWATRPRGAPRAATAKAERYPGGAQLRERPKASPIARPRPQLRPGPDGLEAPRGRCVVALAVAATGCDGLRRSGRSQARRLRPRGPARAAGGAQPKPSRSVPLRAEAPASKRSATACADDRAIPERCAARATARRAGGLRAGRRAHREGDGRAILALRGLRRRLGGRASRPGRSCGPAGRYSRSAAGGRCAAEGPGLEAVGAATAGRPAARRAGGLRAKPAGAPRSRRPRPRGHSAGRCGEGGAMPGRCVARATAGRAGGLRAQPSGAPRRRRPGDTRAPRAAAPTAWAIPGRCADRPAAGRSGGRRATPRSRARAQLRDGLRRRLGLEELRGRSHSSAPAPTASRWATGAPRRRRPRGPAPKARARYPGGAPIGP